jgi:hypothetical protein
MARPCRKTLKALLQRVVQQPTLEEPLSAQSKRRRSQAARSKLYSTILSLRQKRKSTSLAESLAARRLSRAREATPDCKLR